MMLNLMTRYVSLGQRAFADTLRSQSVCLKCATRLTSLQAGAAGAWLGVRLGDETSREAGLKAVMQYLDETNQALVEAQSELRAIAEDQWADFRSELGLAREEPAADAPRESASAEREPRARQRAA
jgi:hypothetical protein